MSESDESSSPKPSESLKRKLTIDETPIKPTRKRANISYADTSVIRLWSEEDEVALLHCMIHYDKDPRSDYEAFFDFVKDSIKTNVSLKQLRDKISKLKNKFFVNVDKGDDVVFAKPHDEKLFELSNKVWGVGKCSGKHTDKEIGDDVVVIQDEDKDEEIGESNKDESLEFKEMYPYLSHVWESDVDFPDVGVAKLIACENIKSLDKECKGVFVEDLQLYVKKLELKTMLAKAVLDQMSSSTP